jgi:flagellar biosynthetic protein FliR
MPASFISERLLIGFLLALARVAGIFTFVPIPGVKAGPEPARAFLAVAITLAAFPFWPLAAGENISAGTLVAWLAAEASVGLAAGLAVGFVCDTLMLCMQMAGLQAGYSFASTVDPTTQADSTVLLVLAQLASGLLFFASGFDRDVIRILVSSLGIVPRLGAVDSRHAIDLIQIGSTFFATAVRLAGPTMALLLMLEIALAIAGRVNAQLQMLTVAFPLKMLAGLIAIAMTLPALPALFSVQQKQATASILRLLGN